MVEHMDWQPVTTLGPNFSPELHSLLLSDHRASLLSLLRRQDDELRTKIKNHLLALGWTIASKPKPPGLAPRLRYVSPAGTKSYYSLRRLIQTIHLHHHPTQSQSQSQSDSCGCGDTPLLLEESDDDQYQEQQEDDAIAGYVAFMEEQNARRDRGQGNDEEQRSMAKELRIKAKDQLRSSGWTFSMKVKYNGREELRYTEPRGRSHISLITACKAYLLHHTPSTTMASCSNNNNKRPAPPAACKTATSSKKNKKKKASLQQARVLRPQPRNEEGNALTTARARTLLSLLIDKKILAPRDQLIYTTKRGLITGDGMVKCMCGGCINNNNKRRVAEYTVAEFAVHGDGDVASSSSRQPWARMFVGDGRSLSQCLVQLMMADDEAGSGRKKKKKKYLPYVWRGARVKRKWEEDDDYVCSVCHDCGELLMCDRCPSMFHHACVGLESTPQGDWFCPACTCAICGSSDLDDPPATTTTQGFSSDRMVISCEQCRRESRDGEEEEHAKLCMALDVLRECFVTLIEPRTQTDLTADIVFNTESELRRLDFRGFYVVGLEKAGELIAVATLRVYGEEVAEVPLVGTRFARRRQGMCRLLMDEIQKLLGEMGVERLVLPAVPEMVATWTGPSFGFREMGQADRQDVAHHAILRFQGTIMCHKQLPPQPQPQPQLGHTTTTPAGRIPSPIPL
ncbi:increased DNA methylation 1 [Oryza sativa Japonica Group]|uniref:increased DNA methylation 1 n=1 Tax=Oryza sativa subsp. japonica TaxID=39947 RepID=UPI00339BDAF7